MSGSAAQSEQLGELLSALCDGQITPQQAARLQELASASPEALRFFLHYVQLHGELVWDHAAAASVGTPKGPKTIGEIRPAPSESQSPAGAKEPLKPLPSPQPDRRPWDRPKSVSDRRVRWHTRPRWVAAVLAASLLVALGWGAIQVLRHRAGRSPAAPMVVARLSRAIDAHWSDGADLWEGAELNSGQMIELRYGLAEIAFSSGARVILDGPASLELESTGRVLLNCGKLAARVSPEAAGFTVATPSVSVVDLGTEFGVAAQIGGPTEVQVFAGSVQVEVHGESAQAAPRGLQAGQAVRVLPAQPGAAARVEPITPGSPREPLVRWLPPAGAPCMARLRQVVAQHPRLIHHYTFEGATQPERCRDKRGNLHLMEVVMSGGRGGGSLKWSVPGFDVTTYAVAPWRGPRGGNTSGVGLQSEAEFQPPPLMTIELLLRCAETYNGEEGAVCSAVATRESRRRCGFLVAAADQRQLTHLMDGEGAWIEAEDGFAFAPGEWYYAASTFRVEAGQTKVNSYVANLSRGERQLTWMVKNQVASGVAPAGRLGIGKGFDADLAHAYPWAGELDEIAVYDTVLDPARLQQHLEAIVGEARP